MKDWRCPACGSEVVHHNKIKLYICQGCGGPFTQESLELIYHRLQHAKIAWPTAFFREMLQEVIKQLKAQ